MDGPTLNDAKSTDWSCERDNQGRWVTTTGRKPGTRNTTTKKAARAITDLHSLAFQRLRDLLEAGHPETVRFVVAALIPAGGRAVELDDLSPAGLAEALASGTISPAELARIAAGMKALREMADLEAVQARLAQIESLLKGDSV